MDMRFVFERELCPHLLSTDAQPRGHCAGPGPCCLVAWQQQPIAVAAINDQWCSGLDEKQHVVAHTHCVAAAARISELLIPIP